jgi:hypothetical protein
MGRGSRHAAPVRWTREQLDEDRRASIAAFRRERLLEPAENYGDIFDRVRGVFEDLLEDTVDLTQIAERAIPILTDPPLLAAFRYLAAPPISEDDLKTLVDTNTLSPKRLREDPELVKRTVETVLQGLDHRRFPWVRDHREPTPAEKEAAVLASAALAAMRGVETKRRNEGKSSQEDLVRQALLSLDLEPISLPNRTAATLAEAPRPGQFSGESNLAGSKADFLVGLWDHRVMAIECKVSNSSVNSVKRLNREAAAKAGDWIGLLGQLQIVPAAVLSGVFNLDNLVDAQRVGLVLYWAHRLSDLTAWIESTKPEA